MDELEKVIEAIKNICKKDQIDQINESFLLSNIESLSYIKLIISLEELFDVKFEDDILVKTLFPTVKSLAEHIRRERS